jgi:hypothetical protein
MRQTNQPKYPPETMLKAQQAIRQWLLINKRAETPQEADGLFREIQSNYENIIEASALYRGYGVIHLVEEEKDNDYQGDSVAVFKSHDQDIYYFSQWGWGSCSGCDALQASYGNYVALQEMVIEYPPTPIGNRSKVVPYLKGELQNNYHTNLVEKLIKKFE